MKKSKASDEVWETPSLEWIHRVRRSEQRARRGQPPRTLSRDEAERLARRYGLELSRPAAAGRLLKHDEKG
jgi:hypothetical protein